MAEPHPRPHVEEPADESPTLSLVPTASHESIARVRPHLLRPEWARRTVAALTLVVLMWIGVDPGAWSGGIASMLASTCLMAAIMLLSVNLRVITTDAIWFDQRALSALPAAALVLCAWAPGAPALLAACVVHGVRRALNISRRHDDHIEFGATYLTAIAGSVPALFGAGHAVSAVVTVATMLIALVVGRAASRAPEDLAYALWEALPVLGPGLLAWPLAVALDVPLPLILALVLPAYVVHAQRRVRACEQREALALELADVVDARVAWRSEQSMATSELALEVATRMGLSVAARRRSWWIARAMDVGIVGTPEGSLSSPRDLTERERTTIQHHSIRSGELLTLAGFPSAVAAGVRDHHEHWDGTGVLGRVGADIALETRIASVCDAWVAMTSERPYRPAIDRETALVTLAAEAGTRHDPAVVDALTAFVEQLPAPRPSLDLFDWSAGAGAGADGDGGRVEVLTYDPTSTEPWRRLHVLSWCRGIAARGDVPVVLVDAAATVADLGWLHHRGAEIWASPTTIIINDAAGVTIHHDHVMPSAGGGARPHDERPRFRGPVAMYRGRRGRELTRGVFATWCVTPIVVTALLAAAWQLAH